MSGSGALPPPPGQRLRLALILSIGLNVLLAATVSVHMARQHMFHHGWHTGRGGPGGGPGGGPDGGHQIEGMFQRAAQDLSPADAAVLKSALAAHKDDLLAAQHAYAQDAEATRAAMLAQPFDAAKWHAAMDSARDARQRLGPLVEAVLLDAVPRMSEDGRRILARTHGR